MADMTDAVKVLDDDTCSVSSSVSNTSRRSGRPLADKPLRVNGKVPDIIYSLKYFDFRDNVLAHRQSVNPFKQIPALWSLHDHAEPKDAPQDRPVIEIHTEIYTGGRRPQKRMPRREGRYHSRPDRAYRYESSSDSDQSEHGVAPVDHGEPSMLIWSSHLKNALSSVITYYPFHFKVDDDPLNITSPYYVLYHHRKELELYRDSQPASHSPEYAATTAEHIDILLNFLEENSAPEIRKEEERHKLDFPMATYDYFWLLLKPGQVIYAKRYDIWTPYVIAQVNKWQNAYHSRERYNIHAWLLESNGKNIERSMDFFTVAPWLGEQAISSLPVVPASFWKDDMDKQGGVSMQDKCIAEGKFYWELLQGPKYLEYNGLLVNRARSGRRDVSGPTGFMSGRVICDASGYDKFLDQAPDLMYSPPPPRHFRHQTPPPPYKDHLPKTLPRCGCEACDQNRSFSAKPSPYVGFEDLDPRKDTPPESDLFYMLLSSTIPGFILGRRIWGELHVENLKPVQTDKEAFKSLVIDEEIKHTVKALIGRFATSSEEQISPWGNDFIKNKGEGRIFLLHGEPGVGKTCTAECIAELTGRPLIALTAGDLSTAPHRVEENLNYFLELGQRYGALVLLDEADIYLERRRSKDIARNGLVSIFLRALEYYSGCIVISTNKVRSFDTAFMSRIHVALHYKNLRDEDRERIWANNFDRLDRDSGGQVHVSVAAREYVWNSSDVRSLKWNGREIRNAMQTALALAESEAQDEGYHKTTISEKHIRAVVKMSRGFKEFMKDSMQEVQGYEGDGEDGDDYYPRGKFDRRR